MTISLTICLPDNVYVKEPSDKVVLPFEKGNLTVIKDRAPTILLLNTGLIQCLNENNEVTKQYFINNGMADIVNDTCFVAAERLIDLQKETAETIEEKAKDNKFYQAALERMKSFKK
jgi:F0F1-type ATP synthase epsilon subunit